MMKFKIGDKIIIHKPNDINKYPGWCTPMDKYNNKQTTIRDINKNNHIKIEQDKYHEWEFNPNWCKLIKKRKKEKYTYTCKICGDEITKLKGEVSPGYFGACIRCDEDLLEEEVNKELNK